MAKEPAGLLRRSCLKIKTLESIDHHHQANPAKKTKEPLLEGAVEKDYYFADVSDKDEVYRLLSNLWNISMEKRLDRFRTESGDPNQSGENSSPSSLGARSTSTDNTITVQVQPASPQIQPLSEVKVSPPKVRSRRSYKKLLSRSTESIESKNTESTKKEEGDEGEDEDDEEDEVPLEEILPTIRGFSVSMDDKLFHKTTSDVISTLISPRPTTGAKSFVSTLMAATHPPSTARLRTKSLSRTVVTEELNQLVHTHNTPHTHTQHTHNHAHITHAHTHNTHTPQKQHISNSSLSLSLSLSIANT